MLPGRARTYEKENHSRYAVVSIDVAAFRLDGVRYQSDQRTKQTPFERTRGCRYESALVPFGEVVMSKIADADKMRAGKLDSAWVKAVWVGRVDRSNEHLLLTTKGCIRSRVVRPIQTATKRVTMQRYKDCRGTGWVNRQDHREEGPERMGSPEQVRITTTTRRQEATRDDPMPGVPMTSATADNGDRCN